ncbi:MAG TPA: Ig-like domain-containing protein [Thermoanaerobaculia bacterium]|nr:Ig-like domain-containing protein [Thermoanaerobaculia bacterium]
MTRKLTATFLLVAMMANGAYAQAAPRTTAVPAADVAASRRDDRAGETPARQPARTPAVPGAPSGAGFQPAVPLAPRRPAPTSTLTESHIFGPTRYVRTNGAKNEYRNTITVPAWIASPYRLHVQNSNVSSATVRINGTDVLTQSDFNPNVTVLDRTVTLTPTTVLDVILASKPASFLIIDLYGTTADHTAPSLAIVAPAVTNDATPRLEVRYSDPVAAGEPAASGVDTNTLQVFVDDVDRTALFTRRSDEATADLIEPLAEGVHTIRATIEDRAGNAKETTAQLRVDLTPPSVDVAEPLRGSYLPTLTPPIRVTYADEVALDPASVNIAVNGEDRTAAFTIAANTATLTAPVTLREGGNEIVARIRDLGGNESVTAAAFNIDTQQPALAIVNPVAATTYGNAVLRVTVSHSDDQALDAATLQVAVDGTAVAMAPSEDGATSAGDSQTLTDGPHTVTATIKDKAGNTTSVSTAFTVDTDLPVIELVEPAPGANLNTAQPRIVISFRDSQGVTVESRKFLINGTDQTSLFTLTGNASPAVLAAGALTLPEGTNTVTAEIADLGGNIGRMTSTFLVDVTAPTGTIAAPAARTNSNTPAVLVQYADAGSGIDVSTVAVEIDHLDVTALFAITNEQASGTVTPALSDGEHTLTATFRDRAGNVSSVTSTFIVDTVAPEGVFTTPQNDSFVKTATPAVRFIFADVGTGVDPANAHVFLRKPDGTETGITARFTFGTAEATGTIDPAAPLGEGTHRLRAVVPDLAGNAAEILASFEVDTVAPTYVLDTPSPGSYLADATPAFFLRYADERSGLDLATLRILIDGIDRTALFTIAEADARAELPQTLAEGAHSVQITLYDRAGNRAAADALTFTVDTIHPTAAAVQPANGSVVPTATPAVRFTYTDASGSGIDPASVRVTVDGTDVTATMTITATEAAGTLAPLADGAHTAVVSALDWAGNSAGASSTFTVDTTNPAVTIAVPEENEYTASATIAVSGTVTDATATTVSVNGVAATVAGTTYTAAAVPLPGEGANTLTAVATDAAGNHGSASVTVKVDRTQPAVNITFPAGGAFIQGATTEVRGTLADASPAIVTVNDAPALVAGGTFTAQVNGADGPLVVRATATDAAGNAGTDTITLTFDTTAPVITVEPTAPSSQPLATIRGTIADISPVTLKVGDAVIPVLPAGAFAHDVALAAEGTNAFVLTATDAAGNSATQEVTVIRDTTDPVLDVVSPTEALVISNLPVVVRGTASDATALTVTVNGTAATITGGAWEASFESLAEGAQTFTVVATDAAGNNTTVTRNVQLDLAAPVVTITTPVAGTFTSAATVTITGTVTDLTLRSVTAGGVTGTFTAATGTTSTYTIENVPLNDGDNSLVVAATDAAGRTGQATVTITRDATPPVVALTAPSQITRRRTASATAGVTDNSAVVSVTFRLDGTVLAELTAAPYAVDFTAPETAAAGSFLTLTVEARDAAGNLGTASQQVKVVSDGVVVGQVLDDTTGLPVENARIVVAGREESLVRSDARGRYTLSAFDSRLTLIVDADGKTTVERVVDVASGAGTVPVDARLTPTSAPVQIPATGGSITKGAVKLTFPAGALAQAEMLSLTPLSAQGLPNLLPLGWSPVAAFDLSGAASFAAPASATFSNVPNGTVHLVAYRAALHSWVLVQSGIQNGIQSTGTVTVAIPAPEPHALVILDSDAAITAPLAGEVLPGVEMLPLPATTISSGDVTPAVLPPTGGEAKGTIAIQSPTPLPSGTVVQAHVSETYTLRSGDAASEEPRPQDIVLYRHPPREGATLGAEIPIVPSRTFADLVEGRVHLDILAGREGVRGKTGGNEAVTVADGSASLTVAAGSLPEDTAVSVKPSAISSFVPSNSTFSAFAEVVADFSGRTLASQAELSVDASGVPPTDTLLVARVDRLGGIPRFVVVAVAELVGGRAVTRAHADLPGILDEGRFVFYRTSQAVGFVKGVTSATTGPVRAVVLAGGVPFASIADAQGRYVTPAIAGNATLTATVPGTSLSGSASVSVSANATATQNIALSGTATTAAVTPANGATLVAVTTQIDITATAPFAASAATANIKVVKEGGSAVATRLLLSASGRTLAVIPLSRLDAGTRYTLQVPSLADVYGGYIDVPATSFTTRPDTPPQYDYERLTFSFPDANGTVHITAPAGTFPPGTVVLVVNAGNGVVVSYTALNDGSVSGELPASIDDRLMITITDPTGNVVNFERSKFIAPDGRTAIGPAGGTVDGPGGVQLRIPDGALAKGAVFRIEGFGPEAYPERPTLPDAHFGSGLRITSEQMPSLQKEGDLVFPKPADAPEGAFYYVYRRVTNSAGKAVFETLDHAFVEGDKVVTASFPFIGWDDSVAAWEAMSDVGAIGFGLGATTAYYLMWTWDAMLPGLPTPGLVTGRVVRAKFVPGQSEPVYEGIAGVGVTTDDPEIALGRTNREGRFALWDPHYRGGEIVVEASDGNGNVKRVTAYQADPDTTRDLGKAPHYYRNIAVATFAFDADQQLEVPKFDIVIYRMKPDGKREEITGMVPTFTQLLIGFKRHPGSGTLHFTSATVNRLNFTVVPDYTDDPLRADFVLDKPFTPQEAREYVVKATAIPVLGGAPLTESFTFLAIAGGGDNGRTLQDAEPDVITRMLLPRNGDAGVPTNVFPQVVFTEPVANPQTQIRLTDSTGEVSAVYAGRAVDASGNFYTIADLRLAPADAKVVSVTLQPRYGLRYADHYTLVLDGSIRDFDQNAQGQPEPKTLRDGTRTYTFDTMTPESLAESADAVSSPGLVVLGNYAWVGDRTTYRGFFSAYDISDPATITQLASSRRTVTGQLIDIAGEEQSTLTGGPVVIVSGGLAFTTNSPSNVYLWDVSSAANPVRKAIISATQDAGDGVVLKLAVHGRYGYGLTFPKGVQVFDLQKAIQNYDASASRGTNFILDSVTPGTGVSQDAIVAAIQVRTPDGAMGHFVDLKVADMIVGGTNSQAIVALAGSIPLAIVDPIAARALYNQTVVQTPGIGSFTFGRGVALGTLGNKRVALLIGNGTGPNQTTGAIETGYVFGVFDMTNPASPQLIGALKLDKAPSDVVLHERKAVVAAEGVGLIIDLSDPTKPRLAGEIPNVGGNIALSNEGLLYSSSMAAAGVKSAVYQPIAFIQPVEPLLITPELESAGLRTPGTNACCIPVRWKNAAERLVALRVVPFVNGLSNAVLKITQKGADFLTNNPVITTGKGLATIALGKTVEKGYDLLAMFSIETPFGILESRERVIPVGYAEVHVDLNNDTKVDTKDDQLKNDHKRAWAFWETRQVGDPAKGPTQPAEMGRFRPQADDYAVLEDFAEIRIEVKQQAKNFLSREGTFVLRLKPGNESDVDTWGRAIRPKFSLARKVQDGLGYLSDKKTMEEQYFRSASFDDMPCVPNLDSWVSQCRSNDEGELILPDLAAGQTYNFLFRCLECRADVAKPAQVKVLELQYYSSPGAEPVTVDYVEVDIRPIAQWMTMQNARERQDTGSQFRPLPIDQWRAYNPTNRPEEERDWRYDAPDAAKQITVVVHGYNVPHHDAVGSFFPTWFRRMYWAGHRVLRRQAADPQRDQMVEDDAQGCAGECAHTIAISWPSNEGGPANGVFDDKSGTADAAVQYPEDEFHALQMGYPLAQYIADIWVQRNDPRILVIAHSLGNVVVNSALSRPELANGGIVDKYVMNEAAMASEVFDRNYVPAEDELVIGLGFGLGMRQAEFYGYSKDGSDHDRHWIDEYTNANFFTRTAWEANVAYTEFRDGLGIGFFDLEKLYTTRWRQNTGPRWQGDDLTTANAYSRGDWRGIFQPNVDRAEIWNTWSERDQVLHYSWRAMNRTSKPNPGPSLKRKLPATAVELFGSRLLNAHTLDNIYLQRWMLDDYTDNDAFLIFNLQNGKWNLKRQWAELGHWFPAVSKAAGFQPVRATKVHNCNFSEYHSGLISSVIGLGPDFVQSHSYMKMTELYKVFTGWQKVRNIFSSSQCVAEVGQ